MVFQAIHQGEAYFEDVGNTAMLLLYHSNSDSSRSIDRENMVPWKHIIPRSCVQVDGRQ